MVYFKLYESQLPTVERALLVAARMVGSERSRGYCLELGCADFLAGRTEESTPEEILMLIHHLVKLLPPEYQARLAGQGRAGGIGGGREMLRKVQRIKLGKEVYRRLMKRVLERDGWRCQKCGALDNLQVHHQIKRSQQGDDALTNLVTLVPTATWLSTGSFSIPSPRSEFAASPRHG